MRLDDPSLTWKVFLTQNAKGLYANLMPNYPARYEYMISHYANNPNNKLPCGIAKKARLQKKSNLERGLRFDYRFAKADYHSINEDGE